ncbi:MAG TPA: hypothetical protein VFO52_07000 [Longimicrobiales bacterium]|nr:hypothetical protein [Longimicrobiales bacterium]
MSRKNPFGDEPLDKKKINPFGDEVTGDALRDGADKLEQAAVKIRGLRRQLGAEGLPPQAERELLDEIGSALDAAARALRSLLK